MYVYTYIYIYMNMYVCMYVYTSFHTCVYIIPYMMCIIYIYIYIYNIIYCPVVALYYILPCHCLSVYIWHSLKTSIWHGRYGSKLMCLVHPQITINRWYKPFPVMGGLWHCFNHITTVEVNLLGMVVIDEQLGFV